MKTSEQIKRAISNISKKTGVNPNSLLQMFLFKVSSSTNTLWEKYVKSNSYAKDINFLDTIAVYEKIGEML